jgi:alpha-glucosidase
MVSDDPDAYRDAPGFDFIRRVPTAWDETRFIQGEPGRDIVLARRQGRAWYVGAMTADEARTERVSLQFLPPGKYHVLMWQDGDGPRALLRSERLVSRSDVLALKLAAAGGAAMILEPAP